MMPRGPKSTVLAMPSPEIILPTPEMIRKHHRDDLAIRFFEVLITRSDKFDIRAPHQAALAAKHCAEVILGVLDEPEAS